MAAIICDGLTTRIERTECIGNSLNTINNNFAALDYGLCEAKSTTDAINSIVGIIKGLGNGEFAAAIRGGDYYYPTDAMDWALIVNNTFTATANIISTSGNITCDNGTLKGLALNVTTDSTIGGNQTVTGNAVLNGEVTIAKKLTTSGPVILNRNLNLIPNDLVLYTQGNIEVGAIASKFGTITGVGALTVAGLIKSTGGGIDLAGDIITSTGNIKTSSGGLEVTGTIKSTGGGIDVTGTLKGTGLNISGADITVGDIRCKAIISTSTIAAGANSLISGGSLSVGSGLVTCGGVYAATGTVTCGPIVASGTITSTGDIIAFSSSDKRLKKNIAKISNALDKVSSISGVNFEWDLELQNVHRGKDVGIIAQEVEKILPTAVVDREDGYKAVKYDRLIPLLIEAVKELKEQNVALKAEIQALMSK